VSEDKAVNKGKVSTDKVSQDDASASFGPETEFESESSVSDKAFFQEEAVDPAAMTDEDAAAELKSTKTKANEEFGAELTVPASGPRNHRVEKGEEEEAKPGATIAFGAIVIAVLSFFLFPSILGPVAAVIGFMAFVKGRRALGVMSMVLGIISFVSFLMSLQNYY
jgi:hypothetical protein